MHEIKKCPTCGSAKIRRVRRDVTGQWVGREFVAKAIDFYECPVCDERIYDREAMRKIEASYPRKTLPKRRAS